jgi:iron complex outermembrane receptor protein
MSYIRNTVSSVVAAVTLITPFIVRAAATATDVNGNEAVSELQEVVVTAQRRDERALDVPIAITAVTGAQLAQANITRSFDLAQVVPGLRIDQDGPFVQPTLRGIGNAIAGPGVNPAVATYIDGYYQPSELSTNFNLLGVESIQVLKGPQGTLFGRNATGGAIVVTTRQPTFDTHVEALLGYGRFNDYRAQLYASTGLTNTIAVNIAADDQTSDGFSRNIFTGFDSGRIHKWTVRGKLLFKPTDDFSAIVMVERSQGQDNSAVAYGSFNGLNNVANLLGVFGFPVPPQGVIAPSARGQTAANFPNEFFGQDDKFTLTMTKRFGDFATLTSYTQNQNEVYTYSIDFDATNVPFYGARNPAPQETFTQEFDLASNSMGRFQWATGLYYYFNQSTDSPYLQQGYLIDGSGTVVTDDFYTEVTSKAYAVFADLTYEAIDKIFFTLGGRESLEHQYGRATLFPEGIPTTVPVAFGGGAPPGELHLASQDFRSFTPRAVVRYNFATDANVFFSFSKGFKAGGYSPTDFSEAPLIANFKPETVKAYELGLKASTGRFRLESSLYYSQYDDQQVAYYTSGVGHTANAASSEIYGYEIALSGRVLDDLTVGINGAWTHGRYTSFPNATESLISGTSSVDISGQPMERTPEYTGTVYGNYEHQLGVGRLALNASYYRTSNYRLDPPGDYNQSSYGVLNARATYTFPGDRFSVSALGSNITDTKYTASILPFTPFAILQQWASPATWGVEVDYKY